MGPILDTLKEKDTDFVPYDIRPVGYALFNVFNFVKTSLLSYLLL